jgi:hypothetical protein
MDSFLKRVLETSILMVVAISVTYLTVLHWHLHVALVVVAMVFVGFITAVLEKWALSSPTPRQKPTAGSIIDTIGRVGSLLFVLTAQYFIIRKRFDLKDRIYIMAATAVSADFFKAVVSSL